MFVRIPPEAGVSVCGIWVRIPSIVDVIGGEHVGLGFTSTPTHRIVNTSAAQHIYSAYH